MSGLISAEEGGREAEIITILSVSPISGLARVNKKRDLGRSAVSSLPSRHTGNNTPQTGRMDVSVNRSDGYIEYMHVYG